MPQHYVDVGFETEVEIRDSGRTCEIEVENEPTKGYIRITKTDRLNGNPIEGVRFDIYENDEYGSALVGSMVTDENGCGRIRTAAQGALHRSGARGNGGVCV